MKQLAIAAIPVDHEMAVKKRWGKMPLPELVEALRREAKCVLRSDEAPTQPPDNADVKDLYFDISLCRRCCFARQRNINENYFRARFEGDPAAP